MNFSPGRINTSKFLSKISVNKVANILDKQSLLYKKNTPMQNGILNVGVAGVKIKKYKNLKEYISHMESFVAKANEMDCSIVAFPQYCGLLPFNLLNDFESLAYEFADVYIESKPKATLEFNSFFGTFGSAVFECYYNVMSLLASRYNIYIHSGSTLIPTKAGLFNQSFIFDKNGNSICHQSKLARSPIDDCFGTSFAKNIESYETPIGNISTIIGDDQHHFEIYKIARNLGSKIMFVPDFPVADNNPYKELRGAPMRSQEAICASIRSELVGDFAGFSFRGKSGIYVPFEYDGAQNGVLCSTKSDNEDELVSAKIDVNKLSSINELYTSDVNTNFYRKIWKDMLDEAYPAHLSLIK